LAAAGAANDMAERVHGRCEVRLRVSRT